MKNKIYLLLGLVSLLTIPSCSWAKKTQKYDVEALNKKYSLTTGDKVFSTSQHYVYRLENYVDRSPDTFEAWIKVPKDSCGGMIAGNYMYNIGTTYDTTVDWGVDFTGRFRVVWGCKGLDYSFPGVYLNDNVWHHVALTRNPSNHEFKFYFDGVHRGTTISRQKDAVCEAPMVFGSDNRNWTILAEPFYGDIKEITMYNRTLSDSEVLADKERGIGYNEQYKDDCIGNWYLGEQWKQYTVENKAGGTKAYLASQDKYVPVAETGDFDYTILGLPDIQSIVDFPYPQETWAQNNKFLPMMNWVKNNIEKEKMVFSIQVGDVVDDGSSEYQFSKARMGYDLWGDKLPYSTIAGNHDYTDNCTAVNSTRDLTLYNDYFGVDYASEFDEFGGTMEENAIENSYYLFETCGVKYCVINLELFPRMSVIRWAGRICEMYPDRRVIVVTHYYNDYYGRIANEANGCGWGPSNYKNFAANNECTDGVDLWNGLIKRYNNIFMTLSGHFSVEDAILTTSVGDNGNTIINLLIDVQCCNHWDTPRTWETNPIDPIMLMKFNEAKKEIYFRYYSVEADAIYNLQNQFTYSFADWQNPLNK